MAQNNNMQNTVQQQQPNAYGSAEKGASQANALLNQHLPSDLQKKTFGIQPTRVETHGTTWGHDFWSCLAPPDLCLMGCCCPCFLFGRTQARMKGERNPDLFGVNFDCAAWCGLYALGGWQCIYQTIKRGDMRSRLGIQGSGGMDFCASWCCACCALVQEEKESLLKQEAIDAKAQYQAPAGMSYP